MKYTTSSGLIFMIFNMMVLNIYNILNIVEYHQYSETYVSRAPAVITWLRGLGYNFMITE